MIRKAMNMNIFTENARSVPSARMKYLKAAGKTKAPMTESIKKNAIEELFEDDDEALNEGTNCMKFSTFNGSVYRKLNKKAAGHSITYDRVGDKLIIKDYFTGETIQTMKVPAGSTYVSTCYLPKYDDDCQDDECYSPKRRPLIKDDYSDESGEVDDYSDDEDGYDELTDDDHEDFAADDKVVESTKRMSGLDSLIASLNESYNKK